MPSVLVQAPSSPKTNTVSNNNKTRGTEEEKVDQDKVTGLPMFAETWAEQ